MAEKETVGVRLPTDKVNEIEQIAEEKDITKSDATRRLIRKGLNLEQMGLSVTGVRNSSDNEDQNATHTVHQSATIINLLVVMIVAALIVSVIDIAIQLGVI